MSKKIPVALATLGCWVALASVALAQVPPPAPAAAPAAQGFRARSILGSTVSLNGGTAVGKVEDVVFGDDGYVEYLAVVEDGKYVLVPWQAAKYDLGKRNFTLDVPVARYREVPTFTQDRWPNVYDPTYRQKIYGYYGLRPGQERRIERRDNRPR